MKLNNSNSEFLKKIHDKKNHINVSIFVSSIVLSVLFGSSNSSFGNNLVFNNYSSSDIINEDKFKKLILEFKIDKRHEVFFTFLNIKQKKLILKFFEDGLVLSPNLDKSQKMFFLEHLISYFFAVNEIEKFINEFDSENIYKEFSFSPVSSLIYKIKRVHPDINLPGEDIDNILFVVRGIANKNYHHRHKYFNDDKRDMIQSVESLKYIISEINKLY